MGTHNHRSFVVLPVLVLHEDIDNHGGQGVKEGEDRNGDKELSRGGIVSDQEDLLLLRPFTSWSIKIHLVEPGEGKPRVRKGITEIHTGEQLLFLEGLQIPSVVEHLLNMQMIKGSDLASSGVVWDCSLPMRAIAQMPNF